MNNSTYGRMKLTAVTILLALAIWSVGFVSASEETENIAEIQRAIIDADIGWDAGPTSVSGLTDTEKQRLALPDRIPEPVGEIVAAPSMRVLAHEPYFDWRDEGMVTPVRSQGSCGSCWAFSAIGAVESAVLIFSGKIDVDLSEQHLISSCCSAGSCSGGWPDWALDYVRDTGVPDEACYPNVARNTACDPCTGWQDRAWQITDHVAVKSSTYDFKWALKEYGPVSVVLTVPTDWYYYRSGVYSPVMDVGWANHAVLLVGWDDSDGCWIIKNSWGKGWGEQGYARVKYGNLEKYNYAYAITGIVEHGAAPGPAGWFKPVTVIASTEYNDVYAASKAIDNNTGTHWFSARHEENPEITFDLGELLMINRTRAMIFHKDVPMVIDLAVSGDGESWRTVASDFEIKTGSEYIEIPFAKSRCQYIRMTQEGARVYGTVTEFDVFVHGEDKEPDYQVSLEITYTNRTETITLQDGMISILLSQNGTKILEWWASVGGGD